MIHVHNFYDSDTYSNKLSCFPNESFEFCSSIWRACSSLVPLCRRISTCSNGVAGSITWLDQVDAGSIFFKAEISTAAISLSTNGSVALFDPVVQDKIAVGLDLTGLNKRAPFAPRFK